MTEYRMVYYAPEYDEIFMSGHIDACFFGLMPGVEWSKIVVLGVF